MSLFKRSVVAEILGHVGIVVSTLLIVWLSVLLVRLLGDAAEGTIGADVVLGLAAFSRILSVSLFIAVLTTVTRSYRESEMVVWFASGLSLRSWMHPVLRCAVPLALVIAFLTLYASPWAYAQAESYRERFAQRSDISRVTTGQFIETEGGSRVFFAEPPVNQSDELGRVVARVNEGGWLSVITAERAFMQVEDNGDRFLVLGNGHRYDVKPGLSELRLFDFDQYGVRLESKQDLSPAALRNRVESRIKARPTSLLLADGTLEARSQIMWRLALPLAALNLALLAIPLGAVNPRLGVSGDLMIAALTGLLYMNLINLSRGWIRNGQLDFAVGLWLVHALFAALMAWMMWRRLRVKAPKAAKSSKGSKPPQPVAA